MRTTAPAPTLAIPNTQPFGGTPVLTEEETVPTNLFKYDPLNLVLKRLDTFASDFNAPDEMDATACTQSRAKIWGEQSKKLVH
jgi:hypothetical protein